MGSALGCVSSSKEGNNTNSTKTADNKSGAEKKGSETELQGKSRYLGDIGAAIHVIEEKKIAIGHFLAFVGIDGKITFSCHITSKDKIFVASFTDEEFQAKKEASQITLSFNAIFKSIVTETAKGKLKLSVQDQSVTAQFSISSVKDAKTTQVLPITLNLLAADAKVAGKNKYLLEPFARMISKKRTNVEEKDKEMKVSRMQMHGLISSASVTKSRQTIERIQKIIVPLREEAAQHSKQTNELVAKVEQLERRIRKLKHRATTDKHPLDLLYEEGGARTFAHLPDAEEHLPTLREVNDSQIDIIKHAFPIAPGAELASISAVPSDPTLAKLMKDPQIANTMKALEKLDSWDMSVFDVERNTNGNALYAVTYAILHKMDLVQHFNIEDKVLRNFLMHVQAGYHPNPYHNKTHAADVCQVNYYIMNKGGLIEKLKLSKEDILAGILAGAIHDYDHPGFNNNFHTRTNAYLATLYNDRSILENHHLACVFEMMRLPQYDIFKNLTDEQRRTVRETMIEMVLATDMGNHAAIFSSFRRRTAEGQDWHERREDIHLALSMSIKMADVSNCGRPNFLYIEWAKNISAEFYMQGDAEERRGLSISPFMDRKKDKTDFPKGQISFMNYVVVPMFEAIAEFLPPVECALQCCTENKEYWQHQE